MATQLEHIVYPTEPTAFNSVNGASLGEQIKTTYSSFEDLAKATLELNKARLAAVKPALAEGVLLTALAHAFLISVIMSFAIVVASVAEESWGWSSRGSWGLSLGLLVIGLAIVLALLKNTVQKGKTSWKPRLSMN